MDSLTQIVLGAGVGELLLGRKLGNRAMVWGGLAATVPDLDVFLGAVLSPAESLHTHRGFSHSVFFAAMAPALYAYLIQKLYKSGLHEKKSWKSTVATFTGLGFLFILAFPSLIAAFVGGTIPAIISIVIAGAAVFILTKRFIKNYYKKEAADIEIPTYRALYWFFFWATFTHPILDCFTVYGTQLFAPISQVRISWDNISVADPAYTLVFGIPLIVAAFYPRLSKTRFTWMLIGIGLSSLYMNSTFRNKQVVNEVVDNTLEKNKIRADRYMTNPTILNNILWTATIDTKDTIYFGMYSLFDTSKEIDLRAYAKNKHLLQDVKPDDYDINTIQWFSKDYYTVIRRKDGRLQVNDMRYGIFGQEDEGEEAFIFRFILSKDEHGYYHIGDESQGPPQNRDMKAAFGEMFKRARGI